MKAQIITVKCGPSELEFPGRFADDAPSVMTISNDRNDRTPCECYQHGLDVNSSADILVYIHPDVTIHDSDWLERALAEFKPGVVAVGLGGAVALGHPDLYKRPYRLQDLARYGYRSNQTDWQTHGEQEARSCRVAVLDAFLMAVRRDFLVQIGGWPVKHLSHHCLDTWLACEAAKHGKEIRMVGVNVSHWGGGSSTKPAYREAKWLQGGTLESDHQAPHRWIYETYRSTLPIQVQP